MNGRQRQALNEYMRNSPEWQMFVLECRDCDDAVELLQVIKEHCAIDDIWEEEEIDDFVKSWCQ